jgi:hypothetical protein
MKLKNCFVFPLVLVFASSTITIAQDLKDALVRMRKEFEGMTNLHIVMQVNAHKNKTSATPFYQEKIEIKRRDNSYLYSLRGHDMLMNQRYMLVVDKTGREILLSKRNVKSEQTWGKEINFDLDSILNFYENGQHLGTIDGVSRYRIFQKQGAVSQIDLAINTTTGLPGWMEYYYKNQQWVSIVFEVFRKEPDFTESTFDEKRYVLRENGKFRPSGAFRLYTVTEIDTN